MSADRHSYDAELQRHNVVLRRAAAIQPGEHVLDIGCGTGLTTREAARSAPPGSALGVDVSGAAIERARELAHTEGLTNVDFQQANAQVHRFAPERFHLAISRFGTMFFDDPAAAFANLAHALRPAGRLVMMVWQSQPRNEWDVLIQRSLGGGAPPPAAVPPERPDPFSLGDPPTVAGILDAAGLADINFTDVSEPVYYGAELATALEWVRGFTSTSRALNQLEPPAASRAIARLRDALAAHLSDDGVWLPSRAWLVTARRP